MSETGLFARLREKIMGEKAAKGPVLTGYDPEKHIPVIRSSICTGEKTGGYKDRVGGTFHEVMLIADEADLREFQRLVGTEDIKTEY